jgi:hypothetical protein
MKKKFFGILLFVGLLAMAGLPNLPVAGAVVNTSTHNNITVDGVIGTDWTDGNYTVMTNEKPSGWGNWNVDSLYFALNETGIAVGLVTTQAGYSTPNQFNVFIDTDQGGAGLTDYSKAGIANDKNLNFVSSGFVPNFVLVGTDTDWSQNDAWKLYSFDDNAGATTDLSASSGYESAVQNDTNFDGSWSYPIGVTYEAFIPWAVLYASGIPANAQIRLFAAMIGGEPGATIPTQHSSLGYAEYNSYAAVQVADADGDPQLITPYIGWDGQGSESIVTKDGGIVLGLDAEWGYLLWYTPDGSTTFHDYMNQTQWPVLHLIYYNSTSATNSTETQVQMWHQTGAYGGYGDGSDAYNYSMPIKPSMGYTAGDKFYWYITAGDLNTTTATHHEVSVVPMPPIKIGFVGNVFPSGGFKMPGQSFDITVDVEQLWNMTDGDYVTFDVGTAVTLNWTTNSSIGWNQTVMTWQEVAGQNARFVGNIGPFAENQTVTYNIIAENNNTVPTGDYSILILVPPPETQQYYQVDPSGDEYGTYPTAAVFKDASGNSLSGLFDMLYMNVSSNEYQTTFTFGVRNVTDPDWGAGYWSMPIFAVMINDGSSTGSHTGIGKTQVTTETAWQYGIQVDGWTTKYYTPATINDPILQTGITRGDNLNFSTQTYSFSFSVPETLFGATANQDWTYYVMMGSGDTNEFRDHKAVAEDWKLGGGDDGNIDPNFCDILVPASGNMSLDAANQYYIEHSYDVASSTMAMLYPVGNDISFVADTVAPTVNITTPLNGATITTSTSEANVTISWTAIESDVGTFHGLDHVDVFIDGVLIPHDNNTINVALTEGNHTIRVNAYDKTGNIGSATISIIVKVSKGGIPGYGTGFMLIALLGSAMFLIKKYRK